MASSNIWKLQSNSSRVLYNEEAPPDKEGCQALAQITKKGWGITGHLFSMVLMQVCLEPWGQMTRYQKGKIFWFSFDDYQVSLSLKNALKLK